MALFFKLNRLLTPEDMERVSAQLEERTGERCIILPPGLEKTNERVFFLCDRKQCENCSPECRHTTDVSHAVNFHQLEIVDGCVNADGGYWEGDNNGTV